MVTRESHFKRLGPLTFVSTTDTLPGLSNTAFCDEENIQLCGVQNGGHQPYGA